MTSNKVTGDIIKKIFLPRIKFFKKKYFQLFVYEFWNLMECKNALIHSSLQNCGFSKDFSPNGPHYKTISVLKLENVVTKKKKILQTLKIN